MSDHEVQVYADVRVTVNNERAFDRLTDAEFLDFFRPPIETREQMLNYLAAAAVTTGIDDASRLDGFADLDRGAVTMWVTYADPA